MINPILALELKAIRPKVEEQSNLISSGNKIIDQLNFMTLV